MSHHPPRAKFNYTVASGKNPLASESLDPKSGKKNSLAAGLVFPDEGYEGAAPDTLYLRKIFPHHHFFV